MQGSLHCKQGSLYISYIENLILQLPVVLETKLRLLFCKTIPPCYKGEVENIILVLLLNKNDELMIVLLVNLEVKLQLRGLLSFPVKEQMLRSSHHPVFDFLS